MREMGIISKIKRAIYWNLDGQSVDGREFHPVGFHGDLYLLKLVDRILRRSKWFIETGTSLASTLSYVGKKYPKVNCLSCEKDKKTYEKALKNTSEISNANIINEGSEKFLKRIREDYEEVLGKEKSLFWLDAHGWGFEWPLKQEVHFLSRNLESGYILIDDFKVPEKEVFGYDEYKEQECSYNYIKDNIYEGWKYNIYYPNYEEKTSEFHPLRGWCLIVVGEEIGFVEGVGVDYLREGKKF
jgi:hypothetical protein